MSNKYQVSNKNSYIFIPYFTFCSSILDLKTDKKTIKIDDEKKQIKNLFNSNRKRFSL